VSVVKTIKKTLCVLIAAIVTLTCFEPGLLRAAAAQEGDFFYIETVNSCEIIGYNGPGGAVTVPETLNGKPVTVIDEGAFADCVSMTEVIFSKNIAEIGKGAFSGCSNLKAAYFYGSAPAVWFDETGTSDVFSGCAVNFTVYCISGKTGFSNPWYGYNTRTFYIAVTGLQLNANTLKWPVGKTGALTVTIAPSAATEKSVSWVSGNPAVAVVDNAGLITAAGLGTAVITCTSNDNTGKTAVCVISVVPQTPANVYLATRTAASVYLNWSKADAVTGYEVYRATAAAGKYSKIKTLAGTNFIDTALVQGQDYYYKIVAYKMLNSLPCRSISSVVVTTVGAGPLLGGVRLYAKGMPESLYNVPYTPEKKDTDAAYTAIDVSLSKFYHYAEIEQILMNLGKSNIADLYKIGTTVDKRNIYSLEIGTGAENTLLTAGMHGNEACNPVYLLKFAAALINKFEAGDSAVTTLLAQRKICMVVVCNPDTFEATLWGASAIRNKNLYIVKYAKTYPKLYAYKANANGVDLNRSFPSYAAAIIYSSLYKDVKVQTTPAASNFAGSTLGSEPETQALVKWFKEKIPAAKRYVDLHSQGRMIYQGKGQATDRINANAYSLAAQISKINGYYILPFSGRIPGNGSDGAAPDYALGLCLGYEFNTTLGRIMPAEANITNLIAKTAVTKYDVAAVTVETSVYVSPRQSGIGIQADEWSKYKLYDVLYSVCGL